MSTAVNQSRRALLLGRPGRSTVLRPPWAQSEDLFTQRCIRCDDCVTACETGILVRGSGGYPEVDFNRGECTFCGACVQSCSESAFRDPDSQPPWDHVAAINQECLGPRGVYCRSCGESCEAGAISFFFNVHRVPEPKVNLDLCTGCGACVQICPTQAVQVGPATGNTRATHEK